MLGRIKSDISVAAGGAAAIPGVVVALTAVSPLATASGFTPPKVPLMGIVDPGTALLARLVANDEGAGAAAAFGRGTPPAGVAAAPAEAVGEATRKPLPPAATVRAAPLTEIPPAAVGRAAPPAGAAAAEGAPPATAAVDAVKLARAARNSSFSLLSSASLMTIALVAPSRLPLAAFLFLLVLATSSLRASRSTVNAATLAAASPISRSLFAVNVRISVSFWPIVVRIVSSSLFRRSVAVIIASTPYLSITRLNPSGLVFLARASASPAVDSTICFTSRLTGMLGATGGAGSKVPSTSAEAPAASSTRAAASPAAGVLSRLAEV